MKNEEFQALAESFTKILHSSFCLLHFLRAGFRSLCGHRDYADMRLSGSISVAFSVADVRIILSRGDPVAQTQGDENYRVHD